MKNQEFGQYFNGSTKNSAINKIVKILQNAGYVKFF